MDIADIAIIGSGAAATTTLIEVFSNLINDLLIKRKINITVVEKYPEFWKGIPYGSRSSVNSLTITAVSDFISNGKERALFFEWLKKHQNRWSSYYRENGGIAAKKWLEENLHLIDKSEWEKVYLPRFIYGIYMQEKMLNLLQIVEEKGLAHITLIQAEAIDITKEASLYQIELEYSDETIMSLQNSQTEANKSLMIASSPLKTKLYSDKKKSHILAKKLVIAIGSAPVKKNVNIPKSEYMYINDLYEPFLDDNLEKLKNILSRTSNLEERNVLIIGSNASSIELMYLLNHRPDILAVINKLFTISNSGKMPCHISAKRYNQYPCKNLDRIKAEGDYDIHSLIEAAKKDLQSAVQDEVIVPFVDRIVEYTIELIQILDEDSKKIFFGIYGPQLSRLIRRSGSVYKSSSDNLIKAGILELLKGEFLNIDTTSQGVMLNYLDSNNQSQAHQLPFKVVINCSGSDHLESSSSRLICNLVRKNICKVNLSKKGFLVNEKFEAAPNLYIMGPLLGGNINKLIHFWHLENLGRLLYLSPHLAEVLLSE